MCVSCFYAWLAKYEGGSKSVKFRHVVPVEVEGKSGEESLASP